ncbi:hypothetical protein P5673_021088 [Acropora cervicornis]|uniref:Uncharacterized protein n=1 Tax=Acropora cervicornis TaxID=6130 RepID=A0AAD9Q8X3_ACRCE|nr:hypothetical protein P5673_021088 [Acropora cervicornis]
MDKGRLQQQVSRTFCYGLRRNPSHQCKDKCNTVSYTHLGSRNDIDECPDPLESTDWVNSELLYLIPEWHVDIDVGRVCRQLVARQKPLDHSGRLLVHGQFRLSCVTSDIPAPVRQENWQQNKEIL